MKLKNNHAFILSILLICTNLNLAQANSNYCTDLALDTLTSDLNANSSFDLGYILPNATAIINETAVADVDVSELRTELAQILVEPKASSESRFPNLRKLPQWEKLKFVFESYAELKTNLTQIISEFKEFRDYRNATNGKSRSLFIKIMANPDYEFTKKEKDIIGSAREAKFNSARNFAKKHNRIAATYSYLARTNRLAYWTLLIGAITFKGAILNGAVAPKEYQESELGPNQVEIIYLSPAPHSEIHIGNTNYNFGPGFIYKLGYKRDIENNENSSLYKNSIRVRLNLTSDEYINFENYLENEVGKMYTWIPSIPSPTAYLCVAATHRALEKNTSIMVPAGIDRSPVLSEAYFEGLYLMGDPRVDGIYFSNRGNYSDQLVDLGTSLFDAYIGVEYLWINAAAAQMDYFPNSVRIGH